MTLGDVQREVLILKALEEIRDSLKQLVHLAEASGLASSVERTDSREEREQVKKDLQN
jgi:hypothetical protein